MNKHLKIYALILLMIAITFGCKENDKTTAEDCGYTITIAEGGNAVATYTNNCANNNIGQSSDELLLVLSSPDTKYALAIKTNGAVEGEYTVKNAPPYEKGTTTLFLTSDQSKIPGALSFSQGKFILSEFKNQTANGTINAMATSAINNKTYTLTGEFKNMPVKNQ